MRSSGLQAENVARQMESADLPAAIRQDFVGPRSSADHLVEVVGRLTLAVNLGIAAEDHRGAHELACFTQVVAKRRELDGPDVIDGLTQHWTSPGTFLALRCAQRG